MFKRRGRTGAHAAAPQPAIAGYRDLHLVGSGGFSKVYTAYQERFARTVAVKVITVELSEDALRRFRREQLTAGQLDGHPHIIRVYESGFTDDDGLPYLTMEYHEQGSLADRLRRQGPLPADEVLSVGVKLACALEAAHRRGIVHRDVKPQNVLLSPFVGPILADFGIAAFDDARMQTVTSEAFSVFHVAPEVLDGHPATPAADLYALVSTSYELLAGRAPFALDPAGGAGGPGPGGPGGEPFDTRSVVGRPGSPGFGGGSPDPYVPVGGNQGGLLQYMRRVRMGAVPPIDRPDVPPRLVQGLVALMARDPGARPPTALDLAERLRALESELSYPVTPLVGFGTAPTSSLPSPPSPSPQPSPTPPSTTPVGPLFPLGGSGPPGSHPGSGMAPFPDRPEDATSTFHHLPARPPPPLEDEPDRRGAKLLLGGAVLAVLLVGIGGLLLLRGQGDERASDSTDPTTTPVAAGGLPPCPAAAEGVQNLPAFGSGEPPTWLEIVPSSDGTVATIRWDDPNAGQSPYVVFASCDDPEHDNRVAVDVVAGGEATETTVEGLDLEHNYCFTVGVLKPEGRATPYEAEDGTHFRCLDGTTR